MKKIIVRFKKPETRADAEFKEGDHPRDKSGKFGTKNGKELTNSEEKDLAKFRKAEGAIKEKIASGEILNSNERYLVENKEKVEEKFGVKFDIPDAALGKVKTQKEQQKQIKEKDEEERKKILEEERVRSARQKVRREIAHSENLHKLSDAIKKGDEKEAAEEALHRAELLGYLDYDKGKLDINNNHSPVPYRAGAALAALNRYGWMSDVGAASIQGSDQSFYITATKGSNTIKVRVSNHGNTTSLHEKPWINISPGEDVISNIDALLAEADEKKGLSVNW